jgi:hypothetical protein
MRLFKKHGFNVVNMYSLGVFTDYDKMCDNLQKEFETVSS